MKRSYLTVMLVVIACSMTTAMSAELSLVALSSKPVRKYSESRGMLLPTVGEIPPSKLYYKVADQWKSIRVGKNKAHPIIQIPDEVEITLFHKKEGAYEKYMTLPEFLPEQRKIIFLTTSTKAKLPWLKTPQTYSLSITKEVVTEQKLLVKNLTNRSIHCNVGEVNHELLPKKGGSFKPHSAKALLRISAHYGVDKKPIMNTALNYQSQQWNTLLVFYEVNPKTNMGRSIGVAKILISRYALGE